MLGYVLMSGPLGGWLLMGGRDADTSAAYAAGQAILAGRFDRDLKSLRIAIELRQSQIKASTRAALSPSTPLVEPSGVGE